MRAHHAPARVGRHLLGEAGGGRVAGPARAAARVGPELRVVVGVQPGLVADVPGVPGRGARHLGLVEGELRGADVARHQPGRVAGGGDADVLAAARRTHGLQDAVVGQRLAPARRRRHLVLPARQQALLDAELGVVVGDRARVRQVAEVVADVQPALRRVAGELAAVALVGGEGLAPVLVLGLRDGLAEHLRAVEPCHGGVVHAPARGAHRLVVVELRVDLELAVAEHRDVEEQALRAGQVHLDAGLGGEGAGLPDRRRAVGEALLEAREHVHAGRGAARGAQDVHLEGAAGERRGDVHRGGGGHGRRGGGEDEAEALARRDLGPLDREHRELHRPVLVAGLHVHLDGEALAAGQAGAELARAGGHVAADEGLAEGGDADAQRARPCVLQGEADDVTGQGGGGRGRNHRELRHGSTPKNETTRVLCEQDEWTVVHGSKYPAPACVVSLLTQA